MADLQALTGLPGALVVAALVSIVKPLLTDKRWHPVAAVLLGIAWNVLLGVTLGERPAVAALLGVLTGLAASGLYSGQKALRGQ